MSKRKPAILLDDIQRYSGVPCPQIAGLRNRIVHDYAGIDLELIWQVLQTGLPEFSAQIKGVA